MHHFIVNGVARFGLPLSTARALAGDLLRITRACLQPTDFAAVEHTVGGTSLLMDLSEYRSGERTDRAWVADQGVRYARAGLDPERARQFTRLYVEYLCSALGPARVGPLVGPGTPFALLLRTSSPPGPAEYDSLSP